MGSSPTRSTINETTPERGFSFWSGFVVRGRACSISPLLSKPLTHAIPGRDPWELPNECVDGRYETSGALEETGRLMGREHHFLWRTPPIILWESEISVVPQMLETPIGCGSGQPAVEHGSMHVRGWPNFQNEGVASGGRSKEDVVDWD